MTPEETALIARVKELDDRLSRAVTMHRREGLYMNLADAAPALATLAEREAKRADDAEAKLKVARELDPQYRLLDIADTLDRNGLDGSANFLRELSSKLTALTRLTK